jgi:hypothetical protein
LNINRKSTIELIVNQINTLRNNNRFRLISYLLKYLQK